MADWQMKPTRKGIEVRCKFLKEKTMYYYKYSPSCLHISKFPIHRHQPEADLVLNDSWHLWNWERVSKMYICPLFISLLLKYHPLAFFMPGTGTLYKSLCTNKQGREEWIKSMFEHCSSNALRLMKFGISVLHRQIFKGRYKTLLATLKHASSFSSFVVVVAHRRKITVGQTTAQAKSSLGYVHYLSS